jgi:transcriptional regulator with XRE-family HTH domain
MEKVKDEIATAWFEYINKAFYKFRGNSRRTISEFAALFGVSQGQMSAYMKRGGKIPRDVKIIDKFVQVLGPEVYSILGYPIPASPESLEIFPEPLRSALEESKKIVASRHLAGDPVKSLHVVKETLQKYGIDLIISEDPSGNRQ